MDSIRKKMAKGAFWLFLEKGAQQIASFVVFAIIVRLIGPEEYGLVGLCIVVMTLLNAIIIGATDGIISLKITDDARLSSIFWTMLAGGALFSVLAFALAEPFAAVMGYEKLAPLMRAFSLLPFLYSLSTVQTALITARMDFKVFVIRSSIAAIIGGGVGAVAAFQGWGGYAIAAQQITGQVATIIVVWTCCHWYPKAVWKKTGLREAVYLGSSQIGTRLVNFVEDGAPKFLLGYFIGPVAVGMFVFVARICGAVQDGIINPVLGVLFPAFVEVQKDPKRRNDLFVQTVFVAGSIMLPVAVGIIMTAPDFVPLFFGKEWASSVPFLQLFSLTTIFFPFSQINYNVLRAEKMTLLYLKATSVFALCSVGIYSFLIHSGFAAVLTGKVAISFCTTLLFSLIVLRRMNLSFTESYLRLWPALVSSGVMAAGLYYATSFMPRVENEIIALSLKVFLGMALFTASFVILRFELLMEGIRRIRVMTKRPKGF